MDIDECATIENTCTANQFCVNSEGSYSCLGKYCRCGSLRGGRNESFKIFRILQNVTNRASVVVVMVLTFVINVPMGSS